MNTMQLARETLAAKAELIIDRDLLERYFYYDEDFKTCCDEYMIEKYEDDTGIVVNAIDTIQLMKERGVWIGYMNEWFYEFLHKFEASVWKDCRDFDDLSCYSKAYQQENFVGYYND